MSREVVLDSEEILEEATDTIKQEPESVVGNNDAVIKSESGLKATVNMENSEAKLEEGEWQSDNVVAYADDEEDVPSDFFDDFSNQDFMAGLDIVDAWDEEEFDKEKPKGMKESRDLQQKGKRKRSEKERRRSNRSPIKYDDKRSRRSKDRPRPSKERERRCRSKDSKSKDGPKGSKDPETDDHRRDPEKTKRDIQKDKDKCAKNKEAKIISEKLKVVETGLVPPGMEMEVDLKELKSSMPIKEPEKKPEGAREERSIREERRNGREERNNVREERFAYDRRRRSRSISVEVVRSRYITREKPYSPLRRSPRSRDRSYDRRLQLRSRSPYRGRSRSRSPYRSRDYHRMSPERRFFIEERKRIRRHRDTSPTVLRRKSRDHSLELSPVSNLSEREMWLRQRNHRRERKLSSPVSDAIDSLNRKRSKHFLEELANKLNPDKKRFLKEIQDRLNEPSQLDPSYSIAPGPVPAPVSNIPAPGQMHGLHPIPGPGFMPGPSHQFFPQPDPAPQYDQQFFIGQPDMFHNPNPYAAPFMGPGAIPTIVASVPVVPSVTVVSHPVNTPLNSSFNSSMQNNVDLLKVQKAVEAQKEKDQEAITKLFEDKKISLSDFLSMSAKHADPAKPVNVQKKIKVISLCQDAIKALGGESKLSGRFFLKKSFKETEKKEPVKFQSPIKKIPVVRFRFTTPSKGGGEEKSSLQNTLAKLLASLGVVETSKPTTPKPSLSPVSSEASLKSVISKKTVPAKTPPPRKYDPILGAKFQMKMCQTDPVKCNICEIRAARKFIDQGVQCTMRTVDSGTQISDEDLQRMGYKLPIKDALKNQSLAHLTPAQILAAQTGSQEGSPKKDNIFAAARMLTPPPPEISPDKQNPWINLSNNDSFPNRSEFVDRFKADLFKPQNVGRPGGFKPTSIFDKLNVFENTNRPRNPFDNKPKPPSLFENIIRPNFDNGPIQQAPQGNNDRFRTNTGFNQRTVDEELDFEPPPNAFGANTNPRSLPTIRGNFLPGPYGGRKFF